MIFLHSILITVYLDLGGPTYTCTKCNANLWYEERAEKAKSNIGAGFSLCCMKGKVHLPTLDRPPDLLFNLHNGIDHRSKHFMENIRAYNSMFAFTSMGGKIDNSVNDGGGPPQFILSGQNYHRIGSLLPENGDKAKFAQLYIHDTTNECINRVDHFRYVIFWS